MRAEKTKEKINLFPKIAQWQKAKILILGFGREGKDSFLFLRKLFPEKKIAIADEKEFSTLFSNQASNPQFFKIIKKDKNIKLHLGKDYLKAAGDYDLIIKSPGIPQKKLTPFLKKKQKVTSQTEIFFENCPGKIVGITGTKGKSTTTSLIYHILKKGGIRARLVGNIGKPVLKFLFSAKAQDIYVYELSSHQLAGLKKSPHIAVFLNVYPDHLDYYKNFEQYVKAKINIALYQTKNDYLIYNDQDETISQIIEKPKVNLSQKGKVNIKIKFSSLAKKIPISVIEDKFLKKIKSHLIGDFYFQNIRAAVIVARIFKIKNEKIIQAINSFRPLFHRLELVGTFKGNTFYNDSLATIPEATIAALEALGDRVETIILGGSDKNVSFEKLAQKILQSKIKSVILFPTTGEKIWLAIQAVQTKDIVRQGEEKVKIKEKKEKRKPFNYFFVDPKDKSKSLRGKKAMKEAVALAYKCTSKGKICLLSTACASFSLFNDYKERGNLFKKQVFAQQKQKR